MSQLPTHPIDSRPSNSPIATRRRGFVPARRFDRRLGVFRGRLLQAVGLAALAVPLLYGSACTQHVVVVEDDGGGGTGGESGSGGDGPKSVAVSASASNSNSSVSVSVVTASSSSGGGGQQTMCFYLPEEGCPALVDAENYYGPCSNDGYWIDGWVSGPVMQNGECCYDVLVGDEFCGVGRPFTQEDGAVVAEVAMDSGAWIDEFDETIPLMLSEEQRATLAAMWARDALYEHASVASFARVSLELMALGAPADLVHDSHVAALDEVQHAKMCFALASRFEGTAMGAGPLAAAADVRPRKGLVAVAVATLVEGCIGETVAAAVAREQQLCASDDEVSEVLGQIAEDEANHAELAWRTVAWLVRVGGEEVRLALLAALGDAPRHMPDLQGADDRELEKYGRLSHADVQDVARCTLVQVVLPCAHALLAPPAGTLLRREVRAS